jgi:hypothetical protein
MVTQPDETEIRELDHRTNDGVEVTLIWNPKADVVFVAVVDESLGVSFEFEVAPADALDAFHHPYTYTERLDHDRSLTA